MKALVVGAAGFVGGYLAEYLQKDCGWFVSVTKLKQEVFFMEGVNCYNLDILDAEAVKEILLLVKPDYIFYLAAQSSVAFSWKNPDFTLDVNIKGCVHLLEAVRELEIKTRVLLVGSSEEYGFVNSQQLVKEGQALYPRNIYAVTKACQNMLGTIYANAYQLEVILVRAFQHIGPKQAATFVVSDFCKQVAEIEAEKRKPVLYVGNLKAKRDFTDVRDIVRAYVMLIQKGKAGETYNVGSGNAISIQELLDKILRLSKKEITVEVDFNKLRPLDVPIIAADIQKLQRITGWKRRILLEDSLEEILNYWRQRVVQQGE